MNQFQLDLSKFGKYGLQKIPVNQTVTLKLYEIMGKIKSKARMPVKTTYVHYL